MDKKDRKKYNREYQKEYRRKNKEKVSEYQKEYARKNRDTLNEYQNEYARKQREKMKDYQKENEELRKDLDDLIHRVYQTNIDVKIIDRTGDHPYGTSIEDSCMGFFFSVLKDIPSLTYKYGLYPYNQEEVRVGDDPDSWFPNVPQPKENN